MQSIAQKAKQLPVDDEDMDATIQQLTVSIRHNLAILHGLIESRRPAQHPSVVSLSKELQTMLAPDFIDVGESTGPLNEKFLATRVGLWNRILAAPDPRRAFVRWLKHLDDVTSGRMPCPVFKNLFLMGLLDVFTDSLAHVLLRLPGV